MDTTFQKYVVQNRVNSTHSVNPLFFGFCGFYPPSKLKSLQTKIFMNLLNCKSFIQDDDDLGIEIFLSHRNHSLSLSISQRTYSICGKYIIKCR